MALVVSRDTERLALGVVWGLALAHGLVDALVAIMVNPWSLAPKTREEHHHSRRQQLQQIQLARPRRFRLHEGFFAPIKILDLPKDFRKHFPFFGRRPPPHRNREEKKGIDL